MEVYEKLGTPHEAYRDAESIYVVYRLHGETPAIIMTPLPIGVERQAAITYYMLEFGPEKVVRHTDSGFYFHPHRRFLPGCAYLLWGTSEKRKRKGIERDYRIPRQITWESTCLSAHQGLANAQAELAWYYHHGDGPVGQDPVQAYVWYSLAEDSGFKEKLLPEYQKTDSGWKCCFPKESTKEILLAALTPAQIAEAERLVAEWKPNPAKCEIEAAKSTN